MIGTALFFVSSMLLPAFIITFGVGVLVALASLVVGKSAQQQFNKPISFALNTYLQLKHPIRHIESKRALPGLRYEWPNGQGDIEKYVLGHKNGELWGSKHGAVYRIWAGMTPEIVISRPDHLEIIFKDSDKHTKALNADSGYFMSQVLGKCLGLMSGQKWKTLRGISAPHFRHETAIRSVDQMQAHIKKHCAQLSTNGNFSRGVLDPVADMKMLPFFIAAEAIYGSLDQDMIAELSRIVPIREPLMKHVVLGGLARFDFSRYFSTEANREAKLFQNEWRRFHLAVYAMGKEKGTKTLFQTSYEAAERGELSYDQIDQTMDEMLYGNLDVIAGALGWNLVFLAANPQCQNRLRMELDTLTNEEEEKSYVTRTDTYLAACVLEANRLRPPAPFTIPQAPPTPRIIDGYLIPANTNVVVDTWELNVRSDFWGPDNTTYRPERFLGSNLTKLRYRYFQFGFGPRQCIGKYMAGTMIRSILAEICRSYILSSPEEENWASDPDCWISAPDTLLKCESRRKA